MWVRFWDSSAKLKCFGHFTDGFLMNLFNYVRAIFFRGNFIVVLHITRICRHIEVCARGEHSMKCVLGVFTLVPTEYHARVTGVNAALFVANLHYLKSIIRQHQLS